MTALGLSHNRRKADDEKEDGCGQEDSEEKEGSRQEDHRKEGEGLAALGRAFTNDATPTLQGSDNFHDDLTIGPVLVHRGVRFGELLERKGRSELEHQLTRLNERDVLLKLCGCDIG